MREQSEELVGIAIPRVDRWLDGVTLDAHATITVRINLAETNHKLRKQDIALDILCAVNGWQRLTHNHHQKGGRSETDSIQKHRKLYFKQAAGVGQILDEVTEFAR